MNRKLFVVSTAAVLGFLVATNPVVAEAARQITGANIKDNSVTTADIKNKSLLAADFKAGQLPAGANGATGAAGANGASGATGPLGATGANGASGATGPLGATGGTGAAGATGVTGAPGAQGDAGPAGPKGANGLTGADGARGADGSAGPEGAAGPQGPEGAAGSAGAQGDQGVVRVNTISGQISPVTELASTYWGWLGPNTTVVVSDTDQLVTATAMLPVGTSMANTFGNHETRVAIDFCFQPTAGGVVLPLRGDDYSIWDLNNQRIAYGVASGGRLPVGSYTIGVCGKAVSVTSLPIDNTDWVNGYVMVVNAPAASGSTPAPLSSSARASRQGTGASNRS